MFKSSIAGSLSLASLLLIVLGVGEVARPGFLALDRSVGWQALLIVLVPSLVIGAIVGTVFSRRFAGWLGRVLKAFALIVLVFSVVCFLWSNRGGLDDPPSSAWRVIVLGVDGATWNVIKPAIERGDLPNFDRLISEGASGVLHSEEPTLSPRVWTTIASGVGPEKHGAIDFLSTQASIKVPRIWEITEREGGRIGMFGWLLTWPPGRPNGFIVPGWMAGGPEAWPEELSFLQKLRGGQGERSSIWKLLTPAWIGFENGVTLPTLVEAIRVKLWISLTKPDDRRTTPRTLLLQGDMSSDVYLHWLAKTSPDFSALVLYAVDTFAHRYWGDFEPQAFDSRGANEEDAFAHVIPEAYEQADRTLGRLMKVVDDRTVLVVLSDHGTGPSRTSSIKHSLRSVVLDRALDELMPVEVFSVTDELVVRPSNPEPSEEQLDRLAGILRSATIDGETFLSVTREATGFFTVSLSRNVDVSKTAKIGNSKIPLVELVVESTFTGSHRLEGVFGAWGPPIQAGAAIEGATLRDVAPTILALLGYPISREMDGRVLGEVLREPYRSNLDVEWVDSYGAIDHTATEDRTPEDEEELRRRLEALGYIQ